MDYESCKVHTTDYIKKVHCGGLQRHAFLIAKMDPDDISTELGQTEEGNLKSHALLLQVKGPADLPSQSELVGARYQNIEEKVTDELEERRDSFDIDAITREKIQKTAVEAKLIGTFYEDEDEIEFGGDVHTVFPSGEYFVYKPTGEALEWIANYMRPHAREESPPTIDIGDVKYSASELREDSAEDVSVAINAKDLIGNKTAVFGMTRTGKSNSMKILATSVHLSDESVGQLIFDPSGEYGNPNEQDDYALAEVDDDIIRVGNDDEAEISLRSNLFKPVNLVTALNQAREIIERRQYGDVSTYLENFLDATIRAPSQADYSRFVDDEGDSSDAYKEKRRDGRRLAAFHGLLLEAGLQPPEGYKMTVPLGEDKREVFFEAAADWETEQTEDSGKDQDLYYDGEQVGKVYHSDANLWFYDLSAATEFWKELAKLNLSNDSISSWIDPDLEYILKVLVPEYDTAVGADILTGLRKRHDPQGEGDTETRIYNRLKQGKTVIIDLSDGNEKINAEQAERFIKSVLGKSEDLFVEDKRPPDIQIYLEEAHRYFDKTNSDDSDQFDPYVRLAKEGAKYNLGLVYATQEVTTVESRVLANTANWVVTHLNNTNEISALTDYYDFELYEESILNVMERGFSRIRFLSNEYTLPVKIKEFDEDWVESVREDS